MFKGCIRKVIFDLIVCGGELNLVKIICESCIEIVCFLMFLSFCLCLFDRFFEDMFINLIKVVGFVLIFLGVLYLLCG